MKSLYCRRENGFLFNNAYIYAYKQERKQKVMVVHIIKRSRSLEFGSEIEWNCKIVSNM